MLMQTEISSGKPEDYCPKTTGHAGLTCGMCGRTVQKSILAKVSTSGRVQMYEACPYCMTRISRVVTSKQEDRKSEVPRKGSSELDAQRVSNSTCGHFFGYLNKREKGTAIPEPCLVCAKMVECLYSGQ